MTSNHPLRAVVGVAAILLSASCSSDEPVGERHYAWAPPDYADEVLEYAQSHDSRIVLRDQEEYDEWLSTLPESMQPDAEDITLEGEIAIVGSFGNCMDEASIRDHGAGELEFEVTPRSGEENTDCHETPVNVELWIVELDEAGAESAEDITLVDQ